jgi:cytidyltransferase-like protein
MRKAVYAGSFDPITLGHQWIIEQAASLFDQLVVAIGVNPDKRATFTVEERLRFILETTSGIATCAVAAFENKYLVDYADQIGAGYVIRGIRNESDFTYRSTTPRPPILTPRCWWISTYRFWVNPRPYSTRMKRACVLNMFGLRNPPFAPGGPKSSSPFSTGRGSTQLTISASSSNQPLGRT